MISKSAHQEVVQYTRDTLQMLGYPSLVNKIHVCWNSRFTSTMAETRVHLEEEKETFTADLHFSQQLWPCLTERVRYETVVHEVCHAVNAYEHNGTPTNENGQREIHGKDWQALMHRCNVNPECEYKVQNPLKVDSSRKPCKVKCACRTHYIAAVRARRILSGEKEYVCMYCKTVVKLVK